MIRTSILFLLASILTAAYFVSISEAGSIRNRRQGPSTRGGYGASTVPDANKFEPSTTTKPEDESSMSTGLIVAIFVLCLCLVAFLTCGLCWLIAKCRNRQQGQAWHEVFDSTKSFPTKRSRYAVANENESAWRGPPVYEVILPFDLDSPPNGDDALSSEPSTKLDPVVEEEAAALRRNRLLLCPPAATLNSDRKLEQPRGKTSQGLPKSPAPTSIRPMEKKSDSTRQAEKNSDGNKKKPSLCEIVR